MSGLECTGSGDVRFTPKRRDLGDTGGPIEIAVEYRFGMKTLFMSRHLPENSPGALLIVAWLVHVGPHENQEHKSRRGEQR